MMSHKIVTFFLKLNLRGGQEQIKMFKKMIGQTLSVIIAKTRENRFHFREMYRRTDRSILLLSIMFFRENSPENNALTSAEKWRCTALEDKILLFENFASPRSLT